MSEYENESAVVRYGNGGIEPRDILVCVVLYFVTFGIYSLYWMYKLNNELNRMTGEEDYMSGGVVVLLSVITNGIFGVYWCYKMGELCDRLEGNTDGNMSVVFLLLDVFGFGVVAYGLMQNQLNKELGRPE